MCVCVCVKGEKGERNYRERRSEQYDLFCMVGSQSSALLVGRAVVGARTGYIGDCDIALDAGDGGTVHAHVHHAQWCVALSWNAGSSQGTSGLCVMPSLRIFLPSCHVMFSPDSLKLSQLTYLTFYRVFSHCMAKGTN